jgi:hypothetical protein
MGKYQKLLQTFGTQKPKISNRMGWSLFLFHLEESQKHSRKFKLLASYLLNTVATKIHLHEVRHLLIS